MKTIKFLTFAMLLSLAWVSCKNAASTENTDQTTEALTIEVLASNKALATESLSAMQTVLTSKITEVETALATASEDAKAELTTQLENLRKYEVEVQGLVTKVNEATIESWSTVANEVDAMHATIKTALAGPASESTEGGLKLSN